MKIIIVPKSLWSDGSKTSISAAVTQKSKIWVSSSGQTNANRGCKRWQHERWCEKPLRAVLPVITGASDEDMNARESVTIAIE